MSANGPATDPIVDTVENQFQTIDLSAKTLYEHEPLPDGQWIRLIRLHPGKWEDSISIDLFQVELKHVPAYDAISYVWGDPEVTLELKCDNRALQITTNLWCGLRRLRHEHDPINLWADAISINQQDVLERGHQVGFMCDIYGQAETVLMWLGEGDETGPEQCDSIIADYLKIVDAELDQVGIAKFAAIFADRIGQEFGAVEHALVVEDVRWDAFAIMLSNPYFSRLWIVQEIGMAKLPTVMYGRSRIRFNRVLLTAVTILYRYNHLDLTRSALPKSLYFRTIWTALLHIWPDFRKNVPWIAELPLLKAQLDYERGRSAMQPRAYFLLNAGRSFAATDDRDHVYALLGHQRMRSASGSTMFIEPDYGLDLAAVLLKTMIKCVAREGSLDVLAEVFHSSPSDIDKAPSWVIRWHQKQEGYAMYSRRFGVWNEDNDNDSRPRMKADVVGASLHVLGLNFDTIVGSSRLLSHRLEERHMLGGHVADRRLHPHSLKSCWSATQQNLDKLSTADPMAVALGICSALTIGLSEFYPPVRAEFAEYCHTVYDKDDDKDAVSLIAAFDQLKGSTEGVASSMNDNLSFTGNRKFFVTENGRFGIGPAVLEAGDCCCLLFGASTPFVLRPTAVKNEYKLIGQFFMADAMNGTVFEEWRWNAKDWSSSEYLQGQDIILV